MTSTVTAAPTRISEIRDFGVFDIESTGVNTDTARILTAFLGRVTFDRQLNGAYEWKVNPGVPIPAGSTEIHGIRDEDVTDWTPAAEAVAHMLDRLRTSIRVGRPIVAYNASYDLSLLNSEARRYGLEPIEDFGCVIDPYVIDKQIDRYRRGKRQLAVTAAHYGVELTGAHDAREDALATGGVAWAVLNLLLNSPDHGDYLLSDLHQLQAEWSVEQTTSLEQWFRRTDPDAVVEHGWPIRAGQSS